MRIDDAVNIDDLRTLARERLPRVIFDFMDGAAEDEVTLRANRSAFERWRFKPRLLRGGAGNDLSVTVFGRKLALPFGIAPTGLNGIHWKGADSLLARAAGRAGAAFSLSTAACEPMEQVARATDGAKYFQLYPWGDRKVVARLIERAQAAGYEALFVTVDSLIAGKRERDRRHKFAHEVTLTPRVIWDGLTHPGWLASVWLNGGMPRLENVAEFCPPGANAHDLAEFSRSQRNPKLSWDDIRWMRTLWRGPLLVKGLLCAHDAKCAIEAGADGVVISNHGGRQLDGAVATLDVLPEVRAALGPDKTVLIDGGFRRGTDIVKAIALGANAVLLGRATLYGVAAAGEAGVTKALALLEDETRRTLALLGCASFSELDRDHLTPA